MSCVVAPQCTNRPASPHASVSCRTRELAAAGALSLLPHARNVDGVQCRTRSISRAASSGMTPTSACACASATSIPRYGARVSASPKISPADRTSFSFHEERRFWAAQHDVELVHLCALRLVGHPARDQRGTRAGPPPVKGIGSISLYSLAGKYICVMRRCISPAANRRNARAAVASSCRSPGWDTHPA